MDTLQKSIISSLEKELSNITNEKLTPEEKVIVYKLANYLRYGITYTRDVMEELEAVLSELRNEQSEQLEQ